MLTAEKLIELVKKLEKKFTRQYAEVIEKNFIYLLIFLKMF